LFAAILCVTNSSNSRVGQGNRGHANLSTISFYQGNRVVAPAQISPETEKRIRLLFSPDEHELVRVILLEECGNNLPFLRDFNELELERFRFAVLKLSEGKLDKFDRAIALAKSDWRDLLMAAGFAEDVNAHLS